MCQLGIGRELNEKLAGPVKVLGRNVRRVRLGSGLLGTVDRRLPLGVADITVPKRLTVVFLCLKPDDRPPKGYFKKGLCELQLYASLAVQHLPRRAS